MKRKLVAVDVDSVLADFATPMVDHINKMFGTSYSHEHVTDFYIEKNLIPQSESKRFWKSFGEEVRVHDILEPSEGAVEGLARIAAIADIFIVTSPLATSPTWVYDRDNWLMRHFNINRNKIAHIHEKFRIRADVLIDDKLENISSWMSHNVGGTGILWSQNWNIEGVPGAIRTNDWNLAFDIISK